MVSIRNGEIEPRSMDFIEQARKLEWYKPGEEPGIDDRPTDSALKMRLPGGGSPDLVMAHVYANLALREVFHFDKPEAMFPKESMGDVFGYGKVFAKDQPQSPLRPDGTMTFGRVR